MDRLTAEAAATASLALSSSVLATLVAKGLLTADEGREVIDQALLWLEQVAAKMPPVDHGEMARGLLQILLANLPR